MENFQKNEELAGTIFNHLIIMKIEKINLVVLLSLGMFACQPPAGNTEDPAGGAAEPTQEERVDEPQVRDGMPESELRDSLATDTADLDTM